MVRMVCNMRDLSKIIPPKKRFFRNGEKLKIGQKWLKTDGMFLNRFGILQQKHLASFHNKIVLSLSILKKYRRPKVVGLFPDSTVQVSFFKSPLDARVG